MQFEQKQKQKKAHSEEIEPVEPKQLETASIDDILDEIDDVLEENAEQFVRSYVQKGGQ